MDAPQFVFHSLIEGYLHCFQYEATKIKLLYTFENFVPSYERMPLLLLGTYLGVEGMNHMTGTCLVFFNLTVLFFLTVAHNKYFLNK